MNNFNSFLITANTTYATYADGVKGTLIRSGNDFHFRVYTEAGDFIDYDILHDDLQATIDTEALASFYTDGIRFLRDHSPSVLELKQPKSYY